MAKTASTEIDRFDLAILQLLQINNALSQKTIAEQVNLSAASVNRRIGLATFDWRDFLGRFEYILQFDFYEKTPGGPYVFDDTFRQMALRRRTGRFVLCKRIST